jgi:hypothetical protein
MWTLSTFTWHHFPVAWFHARLFSVWNPGRILPCPHLIDPEVCWTQLASCLRKSWCPGFSTKWADAGYSMMSRLRSDPNTALRCSSPTVLKMSRNFDQKRLTGAVYLHLAKAFDTVCVNGLLYTLTILHIPSYLLKTISSYLNRQMFEASFKNSHCLSRAGQCSSGWNY